MVLDKLGESLRGTLSKIAQSIFVDQKLINELIKDIQRALLQADVNVKLVFNLTNAIKKRALDEKPKAGLTQKEHLINIVYDELVAFLGGEFKEVIIKKKPFIIMLVGLFGSGKTTTSGKLAHYFAKRGKKVCLLGLDVHRPAAMDQLEQIAKQIKVPHFVKKGEKDSLAIVKEFKPKIDEYDIIIADTAGRDALSDDLMSEIKEIAEELNADETFLVISADIGQAAQRQAEEFHSTAGVTGVITTKMDGTAKAGGALTACAATGAHIRFIGVGEKTDDLEEFKPKNFVSRLLGMGDLETLLDKAKQAITEEDAKDLQKKFLKGEFTLIDLYEQMGAMKKMGPLTKIVEMIPGMGNMNIPKDMLQNQEGKLEVWKQIMGSMTRGELEDPEIISASRLDRIAKGSGTTTAKVRELLKQYRQSKKMIKMINPGKMKNMDQMMKKLKGKKQMIKYK